MHRGAIDRRTLLRGAGVAMALPWLEAMTSRVALGAPVAAPPKRLAFVFVPNGVHMQDWTPAKQGADFELPWIMAPLEPHRSELLVMTGLAHDNARAKGDGPGDHARSAACFLTGAHPRKTAGADINCGVSVDQLAAQRIGTATRFPSLELGTEPARQSGNCDSGYSCAYSSCISWRTPHTPVAKEIHPKLVFDRLFMIGPGSETPAERTQRWRERRSILDWADADAKRLNKRLGATDRRKLTEYTDGVRELERRIAQLSTSGRSAKAAAGFTPPTRIPRDYRAHVRVMYDLLALAFRLDLTRVASFMLANEGSNRNYGFIGAAGGHHHLSHHGGDAGKVAAIRTINRFHAEEFARFLTVLRGVKEGDGTLLDHCHIVFGSAISDGNRHNHDNLPVLLAGRGAGSIRTGRHVGYRRGTPMCNLYVSLLQRMGVQVASFGDSSGPLTNLA